MIKRFSIGSIRFTFSASPILKVIGVNSYVGEDRHILMWDFDHNTLEEISEGLKKMQARYCLSEIHILQTGRERGYHAYCFTTVPWRRAVEIVASTPHVDMKYLSWAIRRERLTLRTSPKLGRDSHKVAMLEGYCLPDATPFDLKSWVVYDTIGRREYWLRLRLNMLDLLTHSIYPLRKLLHLKSGKRL